MLYALCLMSFLKHHKSDVDNYSTEDGEIYCLSKIRHNQVGIQKINCCQLTGTERKICNSEEDKERREENQGKHRDKVKCQGGQDKDKDTTECSRRDNIQQSVLTVTSVSVRKHQEHMGSGY